MHASVNPMIQSMESWLESKHICSLKPFALIIHSRFSMFISHVAPALLSPDEPNPGVFIPLLPLVWEGLNAVWELWWKRRSQNACMWTYYCKTSFKGESKDVKSDEASIIFIITVHDNNNKWSIFDHIKNTKTFK